MSTHPDYKELFGKLSHEIRRGVLVLATLSQLDDPQYGYSLKQRLSTNGLEIDQGTLYPLLRRLEDQGLLSSEWNTNGSRPRRYYQLSPLGHKLLEELSAEWSALVAVMGDLLPTAPEIVEPEIVKPDNAVQEEKVLESTTDGTD